jgi:hypothetical protein
MYSFLCLSQILSLSFLPFTSSFPPSLPSFFFAQTSQSQSHVNLIYSLPAVPFLFLKVDASLPSFLSQQNDFYYNNNKISFIIF